MSRPRCQPASATNKWSMSYNMCVFIAQIDTKVTSFCSRAKVNDPEVRMRTVSYCCPGYTRNRLTKHAVKCDPICNEDCTNGICAGPDTCECFPGYVRQGGRCESIY